MTCIVGIEHPDGGVTIGADSAGSDGETVMRRSDPKLFTVGPYLFGICGSFRMGQLLRYSLPAPKPPAKPQRMDRFMATVFVDAIRDCLIEGGYAHVRRGVESGGTFLVAAAGRLYEIEDDYQVAHHDVGYNAIGCGVHFALGSLHTSADSGLKPRKRVLAALEAAAEFSPFVSDPFRIRTLR